MPTADGQNLLKYYREGAGLSQTAFAAAMGLPLRTYQDLESGKTTTRDIHENAARFAMIHLASKSGKRRSFLPVELEQIVLAAAEEPARAFKSS